MVQKIILAAFVASVASLARAQGTPGAFTYYVMAQTWSPQFCRLNSCCANDDTNTLGIHGLWPNPNLPINQDCSALNPVMTGIDLVTLSANWPDKKTCGSDQSFWNYEWKKHGTCSALPELTYFNQAVSIHTNIPLPLYVSNNIGNTVTLDNVVTAYGGSNWVVPACVGSYILDFRTCWDKTTYARMNCPSDLVSNCPASVIIDAAGGDSMAYVSATPTPTPVPSVVENFNAGTKTAYATGSVTVDTGSWTFNNALLGTTGGQDRCDSTATFKCARIQGSSGSISMNFNRASTTSISFKAAMFNVDTTSSVVVSVSTNSGSTWSTILTTPTLSTTVTTYSVSGSWANARFRFAASAAKRVNIDTISFA
jgi:ribonuclease I